MAFLIVVLVWLSRRPPLDDDRRRRITSTTWQPDARVRDAVGVLLVLAVPDHLVRQPAGRDRLVSAPAADRLAVRRRSLLVLFHFVVPFVLLLSRRRQAASASTLVKVAVGILRRPAGRSVLARRAGVPPRRPVDQLDGRRAAAVAGAIWLGCFIWQLRGRAILPVYDPQFDEALGRIIERGDSRAIGMTHDEHRSTNDGTSTTKTSDVNIARHPRVRRRALVVAVRRFTCRRVAALSHVRWTARASAAIADSRWRRTGAAASARTAAADQPARGSARSARAAKTRVLDSYGWVDRTPASSGSRSSEAMKLTVERGLPARRSEQQRDDRVVLLRSPSVDRARSAVACSRR